MGLEFARLWGLTESKTNDIIKTLVGMRVPTTETNIYQLERIASGARTPMQCVLTLEGNRIDAAGYSACGGEIEGGNVND